MREGVFRQHTGPHLLRGLGYSRGEAEAGEQQIHFQP
jgi:hypothetical protein